MIIFHKGEGNQVNLQFCFLLTSSVVALNCSLNTGCRPSHANVVILALLRPRPHWLNPLTFYLCSITPVATPPHLYTCFHLFSQASLHAASHHSLFAWWAQLSYRLQHLFLYCFPGIIPTCLQHLPRLLPGKITSLLFPTMKSACHFLILVCLWLGGIPPDSFW